MDRHIYSDEVRAVLEGLQQPLAVYQLIDDQIVPLLVSDGFCELLGYADRRQAIRAMGDDLYRDIHPDDRKRVWDVVRRFAAGDETYEVVFRIKAGADSDYRVIHARGKHCRTETGVRVAHVWFMDEGVYIEGDESAGMQLNREMNRILSQGNVLGAADHDALTGLSNLAHFIKLCEIEKAKALGEGEQSCLLYMDLNGMKYYNHRNGFAEGDRLLKAFAELLVQTFGYENCCHIGADRFAAFTTEGDWRTGCGDSLKRSSK